MMSSVTLALASHTAFATELELVVIVHPSRTVTLSRADVANIYLKRRRFWDGGAVIVPVNQEAESPAREQFSRKVLGAPSRAFASYWNEEYFHGTFPPVTLSSSAAVKRYVAAEVNAIGYVFAEEADSSVRVVLRLD